MTQPTTGNPTEDMHMTDTQFKVSSLLLQYWTLDRQLSDTTDPVTRAAIEAQKKAISEALRKLLA